MEAQKAQASRATTKKNKRRPKQDDVEMPPVPGREHIDVQTAQYLEEVTERVHEEDKSIGTDPFHDVVPLPKYVPPKVGTDVATQILEGELFSFDLEVEPILEVLVGKTMHQALMAVEEETELAELKRRQEDATERKAADLAEVQRLEEEEKRRQAEKERRKVQEMMRVQAEEVMARKVEASLVSAGYIGNVFDSVIQSLSEEDYFFNPLERTVELQVMPWLMQQAGEALQEIAEVDDRVDDLIAKSMSLTLA